MNGYEFATSTLVIFFTYGAIVTIAHAWRDKDRSKDDTK